MAPGWPTESQAPPRLSSPRPRRCKVARRPACVAGTRVPSPESQLSANRAHQFFRAQRARMPATPVTPRVHPRRSPGTPRGTTLRRLCAGNSRPRPRAPQQEARRAAGGIPREPKEQLERSPALLLSRTAREAPPCALGPPTSRWPQPVQPDLPLPPPRARVREARRSQYLRGAGMEPPRRLDLPSPRRTRATSPAP